MFIAALAGIWSIYWFTRAYLAESPGEVGWCATTSPPTITPTDSLIVRGETLYKNNCSACHMMNRYLIGPPLAGTSQKYADDKEWLYEWIRDSQGMVKKGDPKAIELTKTKHNSQFVMVTFLTLTDEDIDAILGYVDYIMEPRY